ncbi:exo-alpha-sialidase [bacterium]|nr:exo-alpha-sialidase [bacterium]
MVAAKPMAVADGDTLVVVGTMKGAFFFASDAARGKWRVSGPYQPGLAVYAAAYDTRGGRNRVLLGTNGGHFGSTISHSDDFGKTWVTPDEAPIRFPEKAGVSLEQIWQIQPGRDSEPDTLYCGVQPAAMFISTDAGATWELCNGLFDHPHRPKWQPGGGGLCLHTILPHPKDAKRMHVAISTGGVYRTTDGGYKWRPRNIGVRAEFMPRKFPQFGQCVHKIVSHPKRPERLFLQNHWGLYRSDNAGDTWVDIANGVPSDFGFGMAVHPARPNTVYIVPLESDMFRCTPEARMRVYRTDDAGKSWKPLSRGLPQKDAYETVLRDALDVDPLSPAGVYVGTRSGKLFASRNDGDSWTSLADGLPPIVCVKAYVAGGAANAKRSAKTAKTRAKTPRPARRTA